MSPRQAQQAVILVVLAAFMVGLLIAGKGPIGPLIGLAACAVAAVGTLRYYRRGGLPLDRGGRPFWRR
jgi:hypothetical protein